MLVLEKYSMAIPGHDELMCSPLSIDARTGWQPGALMPGTAEAVLLQ